MKLHTFKIGGVHPEENKLSSDVVAVEAALPKVAVFPLSQHIGAPAKPVVGKGDKVKVELRFRGRELGHKDIGRQVMMNFIEMLSEFGEPARPPKFEGNNMVTIIDPKK